MAYDYLSTGTQRLTTQNYLLPTSPDYAYRIFHVSAVGSVSPATLIISKVTPGAVSTNTDTPYVTVSLTSSGTMLTGEWDSPYGTLIDGGALVHTFSAQCYVAVDYVVLRK